jgi:predicted amidophosphoribosyltransferase
MSMQGKFRCIHPESLKGKRVALIDDVITTGASLESCGQVILDSGARSLDIITLAYTLR